MKNISNTPSLVDNLGRFHIARDLQDWLQENNETINQTYTTQDLTLFSKNSRTSILGFSSVSEDFNREYLYAGDPAFSSFNEVPYEGIPLIKKHFPDIDIFLKNIYWNCISESLDSYKKTFGKILFKHHKAGKKLLSFIHLFPLEMVFLGEALRILGYKNIAYNFNRNAFINSPTKTFEADLFLLSYEGLPWLKKIVTDFAESIKDSLPIEKEDMYFLFQENDSIPAWTLNESDPYVLSAIGWKKARITYRLEEYPTTEWIVNNSISDILFIDSDFSRGFDTHFIEGVKKILKTHQETIPLSPIQNIGYYEEYVTKVNKEYLIYKKSRIETLEGSTQENQKNSSSSSSQTGLSGRNISTNVTSQNRFSLKEQAIALGCIITMLVIFFLLADKNRVISSGVGTSTTGGFSGWGSSLGGGGSSSNNSSISGGKSSSSISSFGGGGFSKGSGG